MLRDLSCLQVNQQHFSFGRKFCLKREIHNSKSTNQVLLEVLKRQSEEKE